MQVKQGLAVAAIAALVFVGGGATTAVAGNLIGSNDIKDNSIKSVDIKDGTLKLSDLHKVAQRKVLADVAGTGIQGPKGDQGVPGKDADMSVVRGLEQRVEALEAAMADDLSTNWVAGPGATIVNANKVKLDSRDTEDDPSTEWNDKNTSFASIKDLNLTISADAHIKFTYRLADGAATGWGAPRVQITVDGVTYSSAHPINPKYGHDNGDGTFTIDVVATKMNGNTADPVPAGVVTGATLVYDYQLEPGTVAFTDVSIDDQPISFK